MKAFPQGLILLSFHQVLSLAAFVSFGESLSLSLYFPERPFVLECCHSESLDLLLTHGWMPTRESWGGTPPQRQPPPLPQHVFTSLASSLTSLFLFMRTVHSFVVLEALNLTVRGHLFFPYYSISSVVKTCSFSLGENGN